MRGATSLCMFDGTMDTQLYIDILRSSLKPFIDGVFPDSHRFIEDNDPKYTSRQFFEDNNINWWKTPAESSDCNPIENLWYEMKEYIGREVKPNTKQELIDVF